jgi:hypothetical protein
MDFGALDSVMDIHGYLHTTMPMVCFMLAIGCPFKTNLVSFGFLVGLTEINGSRDTGFEREITPQRT